jgi:hypothetical protein
MLLTMAPDISGASDGTVNVAVSNNAVLLKVDGDKDNDWWIQTSTNLAKWTTLTSLGTLLSGNATNAPWRAAGANSNSPVFYRARQTGGLFDPSLFRTVSLTFTQSNWGTQLANARTYNSNVYCSLVTLDNGATNRSVGARYKGNTSYSMAGTKKSINLEMDYVITNADLMSYSTVNLNNAAGDESIMREAIYFAIMSQYTPCPKGAMANVFINGSQWGVYSLIQQENGQLINQWFPSNEGDRWRSPNPPNGTATTAFGYLGNTNISTYLPRYELKTDNATTNVAFGRLINAIYLLNNTATNLLRDKVEDVFAVDDWLWFFAVENVFVDDDSYWNKGADFGFYYERESGRIHPVEHDGNEAFATATGINYNLSPVQGATNVNRPLLYRLLPINEIRQRYLAHLRTVLQENFNPGVLTPFINQLHTLSIGAIITDPNKGWTMSAHTNEIIALKTYITNRYNYLMAHTELTPLQPNIVLVTGPEATVYATNIPYLTANVTANGTSGVGPVWLYHRGKNYGRFATVQMFDDGVHGDGEAGDQVYGAATTNYPAGTKVRYYIEARATNTAQAARFSPGRAENVTYHYRVAVTATASTPVVINEFMAENLSTYADPQGEYEDWIELHNVTDAPVDLTGRYLSDESGNPRKWQFPAGTTIPADGYLIVWADEDTLVTPGLHASFKLSKDGEEIYLIDTDANLNQVLDSISFGAQTADISYGRSAADADVWTTMTPTPNAANQ